MNSEFHQRLRDAEAQVDRLSRALDVEREQAARFSSALLTEQRINEDHQRTVIALRRTCRKQVEHMVLMAEHMESDGNSIWALTRELEAVRTGVAPKILAPLDLELKRPA